MQRYTVYLETAVHILGGTTSHHQERKQLYLQHGYHHDTKVKPEAATAVVELLMMGMRTPETC